MFCHFPVWCLGRFLYLTVLILIFASLLTLLCVTRIRSNFAIIPLDKASLHYNELAKLSLTVWRYFDIC